MSCYNLWIYRCTYVFFHTSIPNLQPGTHGPVVGLRARSLLPYCHFELEDSDYIRSGRRNPDLPSPNGLPDFNTRVIEFHSAGIGISDSVEFDVINPTNQDYSFAWTCLDTPDPKKITNFRCHTRSGTIISGTKIQVTSQWLVCQEIITCLRCVVPKC